LVWWARVYSPLREKAYSLDVRITKLSIEKRRLQKELRKLSLAVRNKARRSKRIKRLPKTIKAKTLEEANAIIQAKMQSFFEGDDIQLNAYKELQPGKWGEYQIGRVEFRVTCNVEKLAELLQFLDKQEEGIRIDRLEISSRFRRLKRLHVTLRLASLFIGSSMKRT